MARTNIVCIRPYLNRNAIDPTDLDPKKFYFAKQLTKISDKQGRITILFNIAEDSWITVDIFIESERQFGKFGDLSSDELLIMLNNYSKEMKLLINFDTINHEIRYMINTESFEGVFGQTLEKIIDKGAEHGTLNVEIDEKGRFCFIVKEHLQG